MGAASEFYGIWKFAKNKEAAIEFLRHYADNWADAFKASTGYNIRSLPISCPSRCRSCRTIRLDPADKLAILQDSDEWSAIAGLSGTGLARDRRDLQRLHHLPT